MIFQTSINISDLISLLTIIVAVVIGLIEIRQMLKQIRLGSFAEYTKRYQEIILKFPSNYFADDFSFVGVSDDVREEIRRVVRAYFDLCSEEYFLHEKGYIPDEVWKEWATGIVHNFSLGHIYADWELVSTMPGMYGQFSEYIQVNVSNKSV
jgi:hypothetical protein